MAFPEQWIKGSIEAAGGCLAYPMEAPEGAALPYVIYGRMATERQLSMTNAVAFNPAADFQLLLYASTYFAAKTLADAVRQAMHNFNGTAHGVTIRQCLVTDEMDGPPDYLEGQDKPTFVVQQSYKVRWEE